MEEDGCEGASSGTETFVAVKAHIDNWRWAGVPFYLRTGKRMTDKITEIVIAYKSLPHNIFSDGQNIPNRLIIRLQPNEGIEMEMVSKTHTLKNKMALARQTLNLDFLGSSGMDRIPSAYERLFLDVIAGDPSLFVGKEEVEESWRWCDALIDAWTTQDLEVKHYHAGSMGPSKADMLIEKDGRSWHEQ
jgi:glucose-6-phosphate 1-dehydrogenase